MGEGPVFGGATLLICIPFIFRRNLPICAKTNTPLKVNMEPKNGGSEDYFPFQVIFRFHLVLQWNDVKE